MSLSSPTFISSPHFEECRRRGLVTFKQQERERHLHCLSFASNKTKSSLGSIPDDRSASSHDVKSSLGSIPDDHSTSCHAESSLGSILDDSSSSSQHPDLARRLLLHQQRRAMKQAQERVGNSSTGSISFLELQASDAEEKESSREKFEQFNCSTRTIQAGNLSTVEVDADGSEGSQYVPKKKSARGRSKDPKTSSPKKEQTHDLVDLMLMRDHFNWPARAIQTPGNLISVEVDDGSEGSQYVSKKVRDEKKKSRGRNKDPKRNSTKREQTNGLLDSISMLMRDLNERGTNSAGDKSKAPRSTKRSKSSKRSNKRGERRCSSSTRTSHDHVSAQAA